MIVMGQVVAGLLLFVWLCFSVLVGADVLEHQKDRELWEQYTTKTFILASIFAFPWSIFFYFLVVGILQSCLVGLEFLFLKKQSIELYAIPFALFMYIVAGHWAGDSVLVLVGIWFFWNLSRQDIPIQEITGCLPYMLATFLAVYDFFEGGIPLHPLLWIYGCYFAFETSALVQMLVTKSLVEKQLRRALQRDQRSLEKRAYLQNRGIDSKTHWNIFLELDLRLNSCMQWTDTLLQRISEHSHEEDHDKEIT